MGLSIPPCLQPAFVVKDFCEPVMVAVVSLYMDLRRLIRWVQPSRMSNTRNSKDRGILSYAAVRSMKQMYNFSLVVLIMFLRMKVALSVV